MSGVNVSFISNNVEKLRKKKRLTHVWWNIGDTLKLIFVYFHYWCFSLYEKTCTTGVCFIMYCALLFVLSLTPRYYFGFMFS